MGLPIDLKSITPDDDRSDRPWPPADDCPGCDGHRNGPHRFTCRAVTTRTVLNLSGSAIKL